MSFYLERYGHKEKSFILDTAYDIVKNLPLKAIEELMAAYDDDIERMLKIIFLEVTKVIELGEGLDSKNLNYVENVQASMDNTLKILSYNYFKTTVLTNFRQGWRNLEWGNLVQLYPFLGVLASRSHGKSFEFSYAFPLWRLFSYERPTNFWGDNPDNANRKETALITNTALLGKLSVNKICEEIRLNDILAQKLNPNGKASLAETFIETETGSLLHMRGKDGFIRGLHVGAAICDDVPDESSIYSREQREKLSDLFKGSISPIVEPYGYLITSGTPYQERDIYYELKKDKKFKVFEYPAVFPDGKLLSPDRFTFDKLDEERKSLGTMVFSREYLVVPISDDASIFPFDILMRSVIGMEHISFVDNIESFPIKLNRVVIGADFAISGTVSADFTVYTVWGADTQDNFYLLHIYRIQGASHNEQVNKIVALDRQFRPNKIVCENNGFQSILSSLARERGLKNIVPFTTTSGNKKDLHSGLPSLAAMFERGQIKIPYQDGRTKELADLLFSEFNSIAFRSDKNSLESVDGHDDIPMSTFIALTALREDKVEIKIDFV